MASAVRRPEVSLFGAIETRVTSPSPRLSTSWSAISTPYESDSSRISLVSRLRVLVSGSISPGSAGSGICLTQTTTFMARMLPGRRPRWQLARATLSQKQPRPDPHIRSSGREDPAHRERLGVVGHGSGPGRDPQGALGRPRRGHGRDQSPGPRHPAGPRSRRPGRGRRGRARRRRHAQRGRHRPGRHRHRPGRPARRVDERVRPDHRPPQRPDRGDRRACSMPSSGTRSSGSASARSTGGTSASTPGWASTPPSSSRSSAGRRSSATPGTRCSPMPP